MNSAHRGAQEYTEGRHFGEIHASVRRQIGLISMLLDSIGFRLPLTNSQEGLDW